MNASRPARYSVVGEVESVRRPIGYWAEFNNWWRTRLSEDGCRPSQSELAQWFETNAPLCWRPDEMPSLQEVRTHAKCLRSTEQVRNYFRKYRAARKASSASVRASGSDSDSDGAAPSRSLSISMSGLHSTRIVATGGAAHSQSWEQGGSSQPPGTAVTTGADPRGFLPFVFGSGGSTGLFLAGSGGALALQAVAAAGSSVAATATAAARMPLANASCAAGGASSPRTYKLETTTSTCSGPLPLPGSHTSPPQQELHHHSQQSQFSLANMRYVFGSGSVGALHPAGGVVTARPAAPLPPVTAAACRPIVGFCSGGQPQQSTHSLGPARSIGGGIVPQLPAMHRTASTGGGGSGRTPRPPGSTPTKHSSPAPPAPASKRHATAYPACSTGQTSSVNLGEFSVPLNCAPSVSGASSLDHGRHTTAVDVQTGPGALPSSDGGSNCFPPMVTLGVRDCRSFTAAHAAAFTAAFTHPSDVGWGAASSRYGPEIATPCPSGYVPLPLHHHQYCSYYMPHEYASSPMSAAGLRYSGHSLPLTAPSHTAAVASTAATTTVPEPTGATAVLCCPPGQPTVDEIVCDAGALSPTQAFFQSWQDTEVNDLLIDIPQEKAACVQEAAMRLSAVDVSSVATAGRATSRLAAAVTEAAPSAPVPGPPCTAEAGDSRCGHDIVVKEEVQQYCNEFGLATPLPLLLSSVSPQPAITPLLQPPRLATPPLPPLTAQLLPLPQQKLQAQLLYYQTQSLPQQQQHKEGHHISQGSGATIDAALCWWPNASGDVGSGLPPIRTTLQPTNSKPQLLITPTAKVSPHQGVTATGATLHPCGGKAAQSDGADAAGSEGGNHGSSSASVHELSSILELPLLLTTSAPRQRSKDNGQPAMPPQGSQPHRITMDANVTSDPSSQAEAAVLQHQQGITTYAPMPYLPPWAPMSCGGYLPIRESALDSVAATAAMGAPPPAMAHAASTSAIGGPAGPYQQQASMCMPYPYANYHPQYGYCPPPSYGLPPHHPYYYHQMPPTLPMGTGYEMYWQSYHLHMHAMQYSGAPYHGYPMGPMTLPPSDLTSGSTADYASHLEGSSANRFRAIRQGPSANSGGGGMAPALPTASIAAQPLMPGRYVWQAGGGGLSKIRRTPSGQGVMEAAGECTTGGNGAFSAGGTKAVNAHAAQSTMHSRVVPAPSGRTITAGQGSYCSNANRCYSQSMGAVRTRAFTGTAADALASGVGVDFDDCVESHNDAERGGCGAAESAPVATISRQQLMPPPPPRQPKSERSGASMPAPQSPDNVLASPVSAPDPCSTTYFKAARTTAFVPKQATQSHPITSTGLTPTLPPLLSSLPPLPLDTAAPVSDSSAPPAATATALSPHARSSGACAVVTYLPQPPLSDVPFPVTECVTSTASEELQVTAGGPTEIKTVSTVEVAPSREDAVYMCDDSDLLDLTSITAELFSPPTREPRCAPGSSRAAATRTATGAAAATMLSSGGGAGLDATPNTATAAGASTFAFTPISTSTASRSHAFAAPPRPLATAAQPGMVAIAGGSAAAPSTTATQLDPPSHQNYPPSARSTDLFRSLTTPRALCGSPLDCALLASWLTSPASLPSLETCTRGPLGLLGHLDDDGEVGLTGDVRNHLDAEMHQQHLPHHHHQQGQEQPQAHGLLQRLECTLQKEDVSANGSAGAATTDVESMLGAGAAAAVMDASGNISSAGGGSPFALFASGVYHPSHAMADGAIPSTAADASASAEEGLFVAVPPPQAPDVTAHIRITYVPARPSALSAAVAVCRDTVPCSMAIKEEHGGYGTGGSICNGGASRATTWIGTSSDGRGQTKLSMDRQ